MASRVTTQADLSRALSALARSKSADARERVLVALGKLCDGSSECRRPEVQAVLGEVLRALVAEAEHDIRVRLAERLASAAWVPHTLLSVLLLDDIEIARPVIAGSPLLTDHDLLRLLVEATLEHRIEVARRPGIGPAVVEAILEQDRPELLSALAGNSSAEIEPPAMTRLVAGARHAVGVRAPLARHPRLGPDAAAALYAWVGGTLRETLAARFALDPAALTAPMEGAVPQAHGSAGLGSGRDPAGPDRAEMERRLVAKLDGAGQLRPGYLLRALREGKLGLFLTVLATLGGFPLERVREAVEDARPDRLALACAAIGIDRSVFPTVLALVRGLNQGLPGGGGANGTAPREHLSPQAARAAFMGEAAPAIATA